MNAGIKKCMRLQKWRCCFDTAN